MKYFFDTEFIERGGAEPIRLLSIGMVCEDGRELYCEVGNAKNMIEIDLHNNGDPWLYTNVLPHLKSAEFGMTRDEIKTRILAFIGDDKPEFWAYYADYDWVVLCQLFGRMIDLPKGWPMYCRDLKQSADECGDFRFTKQPESEEHSALNDARWTMAAWRELTMFGERP